MKNSRRLRYTVILIGIFAVMMILFYVYFNGRKEDVQIRYRMIYIPKIQDETNDFWTSLIEGTQMAAEEYHVDLQIMPPKSEDDFEGQKQLILAAIEQEPDAILLSPCRYSEETDVAKKVKEAGIKLILVDSFIDEDIQDAGIATNNIQAGGQMGRYARENLISSEAVRIGIVSHVKGSSTALEREGGLRESLGTYAENIVDTVYTNSDYEEGYRVTVELMERYPDVNLIFGLNEYSAVGAGRAIKDLGLKDQVKMVGFDSSKEEIQLLEEGVFSAIVIQKPFVMGYMGVEHAVRIVNGVKGEKEVDSGSVVITKENMYEEENQKLLFPFWDK